MIMMIDSDPVAVLQVHHSGFDRFLGYYVKLKLESTTVEGFSPFWVDDFLFDFKGERMPIVTKDLKEPTKLINNLDWWNSRVFEKGVSILRGKISSNTGKHYAQCRVIEMGCYTPIVHNTNLWIANTEVIPDLVSGHPHIFWGCERRIHSILVFDVNFNSSFRENVRLEFTPRNEYTQGDLKATYVGQYLERDLSLFRWKEPLKIYNHVVEGRTYGFQFYDPFNRVKYVLAKCPLTTITSEQHPPLEIGAGVWIFQHPCLHAGGCP